MRKEKKKKTADMKARRSLGPALVAGLLHLILFGCSVHFSDPQDGDGSVSGEGIFDLECGNGYVGMNEACDDGNDQNGDGCDNSCRVENGWTCSGNPSDCQGVCGDGLVRGDETCDDGNTSDHDGCSGVCTVENPYWVELSPALSPPARINTKMVFDSRRQVVVLFGGYQDHPSINRLGDTWELADGRWQEKVTGAAPAPRTAHSMAYDSSREVTVLFGGNQETSPFSDDTWEYDGDGWVQAAPAESPGARAACLMEYDTARQKMVLFGGMSEAGGFNSETWEYDGNGWTLRSTVRMPLARLYHSMAYDESRHRIVVAGGTDEAGNILDDTWEYDGTDWIETTPSFAPSARLGQGLAYHALSRRVVMFGGSQDQYFTEQLDDTWEYDGSEWLETTPAASPAARSRPALVYETVSGRILMFGGLDQSGGHLSETWAYVY